MDRLLRRVRAALAGVVGGAMPPEEVRPAPDADEALLVRFRTALAEAGGRCLEAPDEAAARALVAAEHPGAEIGIDRADALLADTGTILRNYAGPAESRVSLWPAVSVFLATRAALVPDLPAALALAAPAHLAGRAYSVLVTGPSRTADIEKTLVIPAHGPRVLVVVMLPVGR